MKKPKFIGSITLDVKRGHSYFIFENPADYGTLIWLVRRIYRVKSRKKRIVKKYVKKFLSNTLSYYIMDMHHESKA